MSFALGSHDSLVHALDRASSIALCGYTLGATSSVTRALERAADRGATVSVTLEGMPQTSRQNGVARANREIATELREHGIRVRLTGPNDERLHLKAAIVDESTLFLDDRNWPDEGGDTIVVTNDRTDVATVASALARKPASSPARFTTNARLATEKTAALRLEAAAISRSEGDRIDVETESFGACAVSKALRARATGGARIRLIVSALAYARATPRERAEVRHLAAAGVRIRLGRSDQKLCVGSDRGWVGSANATYSPVAMLDWGLQTRDRVILDGLETSFARDWRLARPLSARQSSQAALRTEVAGSR